MRTRLDKLAHEIGEIPTLQPCRNIRANAIQQWLRVGEPAEQALGYELVSVIVWVDWVGVGLLGVEVANVVGQFVSQIVESGVKDLQIRQLHLLSHLVVQKPNITAIVFPVLKMLGIEVLAV